MASMSSLILPPYLTKLSFKPQSNQHLLQFLQPNLPKNLTLSSRPRKLRLFVAAEEQTATVASPSSEAARRLYVGNIPRNLKNDELTKIVEEYGAVEKAEYSGRSRRFAFVTMKTVEDANAAIEKLNGTQIGGREIKVNITEKPLPQVDLSLLQAEDSQFVDSPHKVYVGNLAKTVTSETLKKFFSEKGKVMSAKVSRVPGSSKSGGFGFVSFSSDEEVEAAISSFNNAGNRSILERVCKTVFS
ncbi:30S ribosomal protein 2, chloroplastic-like [Gossypium australe]|uniref:Small ribosomal subunit protein cS22 n=1 Tax=Gossypium australe TaxID=47621 RepID=A0A5B6U766_9ROSI|nr:30S ribosomal protein 2, chloroplastic-like [Gossypium australe]